MKTLIKVAKWIGILLFAVVLIIVVALAIAHEPRPEGRPGEDADAMAARLEDAVDVEAWARTKAVRWTFAGRHHHLWDRQRDVTRLRWGDVEVLLRLDGPRGRAFVGGNEVIGEQAEELIEQAYAAWVNDSFWLNPIAMFRGEGISRSLVTLEDGGEGLLVAFASGGLTPGDAYLWIPGDDGRPRAWRMWVSIIPIGGVELSWTGWQRLDTGALIATGHEGPFGFSLELTDVAGAESLSELVPGDDPFALLF